MMPEQGPIMLRLLVCYSYFVCACGISVHRAQHRFVFRNVRMQVSGKLRQVRPEKGAARADMITG